MQVLTKVFVIHERGKTENEPNILKNHIDLAIECIIL
jgi:hypothetical protein